jgi:hypothetical protein
MPQKHIDSAAARANHLRESTPLPGGAIAS